MARLARLVVPGLPHHVTQRGNRRQQTFFCDEDYAAYVELMADWCKERGVEIWAYCLMPNHVHLIAVPKSEDGLGAGHRRGPSSLYAADQFPREMAGLSVARAFCLVRDGRAVLAGGGPLRGIESGAGRFGGRCRRLALEQCKGALVGPRRPIGARGSDAGDGRQLARLVGQCDSGRGIAGFSRARSHRLSVGKCHVCGSAGTSGRSYPAPTESRPSIEITQTPIIGSCPPNWCPRIG